MSGAGAGAGALETAELELTPKQQMQVDFGKQLMKERNFNRAGFFFEDVLGAVVTKYGEKSLAVASLYYLYGNALLREAETIGNVFGSAMEDAQAKTAAEVVEDADADADADDAADGDAAAADEGDDAAEEEDAGTNKCKGKGKGKGKDDGAAAAAAAATDAATEALAAAMASKLAEFDAADTDDAPDREEMLEISWEVLDLARSIYEKLGATAAHKAELVNVLSALGDHNVESDHFEEAVLEYKKCLALREEVSPDDLRGLADTHYLLALALEMVAMQADEPAKGATMRQEVVQHLHAARSLLLQHLRTTLSGVEGSEPFFAALVTAAPWTAVANKENSSADAAGAGKGKGKGKAEEAASPSEQAVLGVWTAHKPAGIAEDAAQNVQELAEIIDSLSTKAQDVASDEGTAPAAAAAAAAAADGSVPVVTSGKTTIGFGAPSAATATATAPVTQVNTLLVKRKPASASGTGAGAGASAGASATAAAPAPAAPAAPEEGSGASKRVRTE